MKKIVVCVLSMALVSTVAIAAGRVGHPKTAPGNPDSVVYDEASAMAFLATTAGQWYEDTTSSSSGSHVPKGAVTIKTKAAHSAVIFNYQDGTPMAMETVFHMDGQDKLLLTHYCALQNAPVLQFQKSDKPGEMKFLFQGGTNFDPQVDEHFHDQVFQVIDKNTIEQRTTVYKNGKPLYELKATLSRQGGN